MGDGSAPWSGGFISLVCIACVCKAANVPDTSASLLNMHPITLRHYSCDSDLVKHACTQFQQAPEDSM